MKGLREAIEVEWDMMNDEVDACDWCGERCCNCTEEDEDE
jgi:hypothetical protein